MRVAVVGGGPAGLYFAALAKSREPAREVTVWERNDNRDQFGFGLVFSEGDLDRIDDAGIGIHATMREQFVHWSALDIHYRRQVQTANGHRFAGISRGSLLRILQDRCAALGVEFRPGVEAAAVDRLSHDRDLVVVADGVHSATRARYAHAFRPRLDRSGCWYMWLAVDRPLTAFAFVIAETEHGPVQAHAYPYSRDRSTVIVEVDDRTWRGVGFDRLAARAERAGASDEDSVAVCSRLFHDFLGGHRLVANKSRWQRFTAVRNATWQHRNLVLLGDAAHTAHFSIGSGTKLAMDGARQLADSLDKQDDLGAALDSYEQERRPVVAALQRAAEASSAWFESLRWRVGQPPEQLGFSLLTRSGRVSPTKLRARDPEYVARVEAWFDRSVGGTGEAPAPPVRQPFRLGDRWLRSRIVATPNGPVPDATALLLVSPDGRTREQFAEPLRGNEVMIGARLDDQRVGDVVRAGFDLLEVPLLPEAALTAVRAEWPADRPLVVRLPPDDIDDEGVVPEIGALVGHGVDAVHVTCPDDERSALRTRRIALAERIRAETGVPVMCSGGPMSLDQANSIVLGGRADLVAVAA